MANEYIFRHGFISLTNGEITNTLTTANLTIGSLSNQATETTTLMINGSNVVGTRELGTNAFTSTTFDNYVSWTVGGNSGVNQTIGSGDTLSITGTEGIETVGTNTDSLIISHTNTVTADTAEGGSGALNYGDSFTIPAVAYDSEGHVTGFSTNSYTLPTASSIDNIFKRVNVGTGATADNNEIVTDQNNDLLQFQGGGTTVITTDSTTDTVIITSNDQYDGTVTSVTAGNGMTQSGTSTLNPTLNIVSHAGTANTIGTINISADSIGVTLGTSATSAAAGNHTHAQLHTQNTDTGTTSTTFQLDSASSGPIIKNGGSNTLEVRNSGDTDYGHLIVEDLTVKGTTTTIESETVTIADNVIVLNSDYTGSVPSSNAGIEIERGTVTNAAMTWNESTDKWMSGIAGSETEISLVGHSHTPGESGITPAALTRTNDTNVTLTLGGTPATSLLQNVSMTLGWSGDLSVARGGTGISSGVSGGIPYYASTSTMASSAVLTNNAVMIGGGAGSAPETISVSTVSTHALFATAGAPAFRAVASGDIPNLAASKITSGTFPIARGGTNITTYATGDMLYASAANTLAKLTIGSNGEVLKIVGGIPTWGTDTNSGVTTITNIGSTPNSAGGTIAGTSLTLQPASVSFGGVITTSAQRFNGSKTFASDVKIGGTSAATSVKSEYLANTGVTTGGTRVVASFSMTDKMGAHIDYGVVNGTNSRIGTVMIVWNGANDEFTDNSTNDIGDTSGVVFDVNQNGTNMELTVTTTTSTWAIKTNVRTI